MFVQYPLLTADENGKLVDEGIEHTKLKNLLVRALPKVTSHRRYDVEDCGSGKLELAIAGNRSLRTPKCQALEQQHCIRFQEKIKSFYSIPMKVFRVETKSIVILKLVYQWTIVVDV